MKSSGASTEFFNISRILLSVMQCIAGGIEFRRDIEDHLKVSQKQTLRAIDKLSQAGMIKITPCRSPGRGGKSLRIYRLSPTTAGLLMLSLCDDIAKHRKSNRGKSER